MVTCSSHQLYPIYSLFQVSGMGNCLYASVKKGLGVHLANDKEFPYYSNRYFRWQVANWLVKNRKSDADQESLPTAEDPNATFLGPFSYKEYCRHVLDRRFWGDALILYAISCMWASKITVINSKTLEEYRVQHNAPLRRADISVVFNASCHYTAAGRLSSVLVACHLLTVEKLVA